MKCALVTPYKELEGAKSVEGPINLLRFSANMGTNVHLVAIAARNIHIATIDPANDFKVQHRARKIQ